MILEDAGTLSAVVFGYYEVVKIRSTPGTIREGIAELEGAVLGISEEQGQTMSYAVSVYERGGVCWSLARDFVPEPVRADPELRDELFERLRSRGARRWVTSVAASHSVESWASGILAAADLGGSPHLPHRQRR